MLRQKSLQCKIIMINLSNESFYESTFVQPYGKLVEFPNFCFGYGRFMNEFKSDVLTSTIFFKSTTFDDWRTDNNAICCNLEEVKYPTPAGMPHSRCNSLMVLTNLN